MVLKSPIAAPPLSLNLNLIIGIEVAFGRGSTPRLQPVGHQKPSATTFSSGFETCYGKMVFSISLWVPFIPASEMLRTSVVSSSTFVRFLFNCSSALESRSNAGEMPDKSWGRVGEGYRRVASIFSKSVKYDAEVAFVISNWTCSVFVSFLLSGVWFGVFVMCYLLYIFLEFLNKKIKVIFYHSVLFIRHEPPFVTQFYPTKFSRACI